MASRCAGPLPLAPEPGPGLCAGARGYHHAVPKTVAPAEPFTALADVYDRIMAEVEYHDWVSFILSVASERGWGGGRLLDLGCGTGNATLPVHALGLEVEGLDASERMLAVARSKLPDVTFHRASFERFTLTNRFTLIYSVFDSLNNLLDDDSFLETAARVRHHLEPGGLFIFDVNTPVGLRELWHGGVAAGWADDVYYRWQHSYDAATGLARVEAFCDTPDGSFTEVHFERGYSAAEAERLLKEAGFVNVEPLLYPDGAAPDADSERIWVAAQRPARRRVRRRAG